MFIEVSECFVHVAISRFCVLTVVSRFLVRFEIPSTCSSLFADTVVLRFLLHFEIDCTCSSFVVLWTYSSFADPCESRNSWYM